MKEVFEYILSLFKSRIFPLILVFAILVGVLINRLFGLQIINGESYVKDLSSSIQKDMSVAATRGRIFDKNGAYIKIQHIHIKCYAGLNQLIYFILFHMQY